MFKKKVDDIFIRFFAGPWELAIPIIPDQEITTEIIFDKESSWDEHNFISENTVPKLEYGIDEKHLFKIIKNKVKAHPIQLSLQGPTGVGKSTLVCYLINSLLSLNKKVILLDIDIGQPIIGSPGLIYAYKVFIISLHDRLFLQYWTTPALRLHKSWLQHYLSEVSSTIQLKITGVDLTKCIRIYRSKIKELSNIVQHYLSRLKEKRLYTLINKHGFNHSIGLKLINEAINKLSINTILEIKKYNFSRVDEKSVDESLVNCSENTNSELATESEKMISNNTNVHKLNNKYIPTGNYLNDTSIQSNKMSNPNVQMSNPNDQMSNPNDQMSSPNDQMSNPNVQMSNPNVQMSNPNVQNTTHYYLEYYPLKIYDKDEKAIKKVARWNLYRNIPVSSLAKYD